MTYSALVVTVVHHPEDARIRHRQITALLEHGWQVTYAAPFNGYGLTPAVDDDRLRPVDLPRAHGRHRHRALRAARRLLRDQADLHDVVLLHDPELLLASDRLGPSHIVWDVHEDTSSAIEAKGWLPGPVRGLARASVRHVERVAERRMALLLAEHAYRSRFTHLHPVVPNTVRVPDRIVAPGIDRVVYLGTVTVARGARTMVDMARMLRQRTGGSCTLEVIGPAADSETRQLMSCAADRGDLIWHGFVSGNRALPMLDGALAGISLLRDLPNYRHSMPTKIMEYMAHGIPVVTTPLPLPAQQVRDTECGVVVPFDDADAVVEALLDLRANPAHAGEMGARGHAEAAEHHDWARQSADFVAALSDVAQSRGRGTAGVAARSR